MKRLTSILLALLISILVFSSCSITNKKTGDKIIEQREEQKDLKGSSEHVDSLQEDKITYDDSTMSNENQNTSNNKDALIESFEDNYFKFKSNTTVYFDIDQDGTDEKIKYEIDEENLRAKLIVNEFEPIEIDTIKTETRWFIIINYTDKYGTNMNMIGLLDYGLSADPVTTLYSIIAPNDEKTLVSVGEVNAQIVTKSNYNDPYNSYDFYTKPSTDYLKNTEDFMAKAIIIKDQGIESPVYLTITIPQVWYGRTLYTYDTTDCSLIDNYTKEGEDYKTYCVLSITNSVRAYTQKDTNAQYSILKEGQNVLLYATDNIEWVAMEAEDGTKGWVHINDITHDNFEGFLVFG